MRALFIDHYDSFSFNVIDLMESCGVSEIVHVYYDNICADLIEVGVERFDFDFIVLSPGPGRPSDKIETLDFIKKCIGKIPIFGVCLGLQIIADIFGAKVVGAPEFQHGSKKKIDIDTGAKLFHGFENELSAASYNSLCVFERDFLGNEEGVSVIATSAGNVIEALEIVRPNFKYIAATQFHPESFMSEKSKDIFNNFLRQIH